jgi:nucleoside-diphosphate-sugar epimerase
VTALVTGSSGHLGEALVRELRGRGDGVRGLDVQPSLWTDVVGSVVDRDVLRTALAGVDTVFHTATLHKPHVATHSRQAFVDTNVSGTLAVLEEGVRAGVRRVIFTSTTSAFGAALRPPAGAPAVWVTEALRPVPRNVYGVTKIAAEDLCELIHRRDGLPVLILRTARFFPEEDDDEARRAALADGNLKVLEFLNRRVSLEDVVGAHLCARDRAEALGFGRWIVSAATPFRPEDAARLRGDLAAVLEERLPGSVDALAGLGWGALPGLDRVYDASAARRDLDWHPADDFTVVLERVRRSGDWRGPLARAVGAKGYHDRVFEEGPFPVEEER